MKYRVWDESCKESNEENVCYFGLDNVGDKAVGLRAVNKDGGESDDGHLAVLDPRLRCMVLIQDISPDVPLKSTFEGCMLVVEYHKFKEWKKERAMEHFSEMIQDQLRSDEKEESTIQ